MTGGSRPEAGKHHPLCVFASGERLVEKTVAALDGAKDLKPGESRVVSSSWAKVDPPPTTTKENIEQSQFWAQIGWAPIEEPGDRNMDLVSDRFDKYLEHGCPECKSAWLELLAIGYTSQRTYGGDAKWNGRYFDVSTKPMHNLDDRAVRVECWSGHRFDFDSFTGRSRKYETPSWALMGILGLGAIAMYGYVSRMKGKL